MYYQINEIWMPVHGYNGIYSVSSTGRIKNKYDKILRPSNDNRGYLHIGLSKNGNRKFIKVHRIVLMSFDVNENQNLQINHIDGDKKNNSIYNLEWCTASENLIHAYSILNRKTNSKTVNQFMTNGDFIKSYYSIKEASINTRIKDSNISFACNGKRKTAGGYKWKYSCQPVQATDIQPVQATELNKF